MADTVLNLRGLKCPLPALRTRKELSRLAAGDELVVECTDPLSAIDIPNLLGETASRRARNARRDRSDLPSLTSSSRPRPSEQP